MLNLSIVQGTLSSAPAIRHLDSGARLATLQVTVRGDEGPARSVPVTVWDPPANVADLASGDGVVVVGHVHRRFFTRPDGGRASVVEIVAAGVAPSRDRRRARALVRRAARMLAAANGT